VKVRNGSGNTATRLAMRTLAIIIAGSDGQRLGDVVGRDSVATPRFGDQYRDLDAALANCADVGIRRIAIVTQSKPPALIRHVQHGWCILRPELGERLEIWPAERCRNRRYHGDADAVHQNVDLIEEAGADHVLVVASGAVPRVDYGELLEAHVAAGVGATVACKTVPIANANDFGVLTLDERGSVRHYAEKPARPTPLPYDPGRALVSIGTYAFERGLLADCLHADASDPFSSHDFGRDILPLLVRANGLAVHAFRDPRGGLARDGGMSPKGAVTLQ
jgi:glucose-1-phosphate adenylyltransferase